MPRSDEKLRDDALAIWRAGVEAVRGDRLVREAVQLEGTGSEQRLVLADEEEISLAEIRQILVVGGGKAGAGMAAGLEEALSEELLREKQVTGWLNVPADCVRPLTAIHLHAARPAGVNEPREEGVEGTEEILRQVSELGPRDLCICLLSGGGSALLPAPVAGVPLSEKVALARHLSGAGANIEELNAVRRPLSRIKGGGLARACRAGRLVTLVISDVIGDPLETIASGPTWINEGGELLRATAAAAALAVMEKFNALAVAPDAARVLREMIAEKVAPADATCQMSHFIVGNNGAAIDAAGIEAERRGYSHAMHGSTTQEPTAEEVGRKLAQLTLRMRDEGGPDCLITGGEPTVRLVPAAERGRGGRNQQLVLAALVDLMQVAGEGENGLAGLALLSGGTDGEDGPTDAAGAVIGRETVERLLALGLDPQEFLARNDAYSFFAQTGDLIQSGPTHTNVCDLRVAVVAREEI